MFYFALPLYQFRESFLSSAFDRHHSHRYDKYYSKNNKQIPLSISQIGGQGVDVTPMKFL